MSNSTLPAAVAIHGRRAVTISLPGPHESALGVESLIFMRQAPAEMDRGRRGRNPASVISKMESTSDRPGGHNLLCCCGRPADFRLGAGARLGDQSERR